MCLGLLLVLALRAGYATEARLGKARRDHDRAAFQRLFDGLITYVPSTNDFSVRLDADAERLVGVTVGMRPAVLLRRVSLIPPKR